MHHDFWYVLVDERGDPAFEGVGADIVSFSTDRQVLVAHLRNAVWGKNQRIIEGVAAQLKIYSNKNDIIDPSIAPLQASALVGDRGESEDAPLFVVVPQVSRGKHRKTNSSLFTLHCFIHSCSSRHHNFTPTSKYGFSTCSPSTVSFI
jgi:hypothetical protein